MRSANSATSPLLFNRHYWERDLRLCDYSDTLALRNTPEALAEALSRALHTKGQWAFANALLGLEPGGGVKTLQRRLLADPDHAVLLILISQFCAYKSPAAISDAAQLYRDGLSQLSPPCPSPGDRLSTLLALFTVNPAALIDVRALNRWHKSGAAPMVLKGAAPIPQESFETLFTRARVQQVLRSAAREVCDLHVDSLIHVSSRVVLVVLRRNHRRAYHWRADAQSVQIGHHAELVMLEFSDFARRVRIGSISSRAPRLAAEAIGRQFFGAECHYIDEEQAVAERQVENLIAAICDPNDGRLPVVELKLKQTPLGRTRLTLDDDAGQADLYEAIERYEEQIGALYRDLDDVVRLKVHYEGHRLPLFFPRHNGRRVVEYGDSRIDHHVSASFVAFVAREFRITPRSTERKSGR